MRFPDSLPTSREEWHVVAWAFIVVFMMIGTVACWYAWHSPAENPDVAAKLWQIGLGSWTLAALTWGLKRAIAWYLG
jgi:hypothetical protein